MDLSIGPANYYVKRRMTKENAESREDNAHLRGSLNDKNERCVIASPAASKYTKIWF